MVVENKDGKGNPNHDDATGEFTTSGGGGAKAPRRETTYIDIEGKGEGCGYSAWRAKKRGETTPPPPTPEPPKPEPPKPEPSKPEPPKPEQNVSDEDSAILEKYDKIRNDFEAHLNSNFNHLPKKDTKQLLEMLDSMKDKVDQAMLMHALMKRKVSLKKTRGCSQIDYTFFEISLNERALTNSSLSYYKGQSIIHEFSHGLDRVMGNLWTNLSSDFKNEDGQSLDDCIKEEAKKLIDDGTFDKLKDIAYKEAEEEIKEKGLSIPKEELAKRKYGALSDCFSFHQNYGFISMGHRTSYALKPGYTANEFFANCMSYKNVGDLTSVKKYLPKSYEMFLKARNYIKNKIYEEIKRT